MMRRARPLFATLALLALLITPTALRADSPRTMNLELEMSSYTPAVDSGVSGATPYDDIFGGAIFPLFRVRVDRMLYQGWGTLAAGLGLGYGSVSGKGRLVDGSKSKDDTTLHLMPGELGLMYQFDWAAERWSIPVVPFARFDLAYTIWWFTNGVGDVSSYEAEDGETSEGYGGTWGYRYGAGLKLLLDVFAPEMAHTFDVDFGVNNSYLVAEAVWSDIDDFGSGESIQVGADAALYFGIAFEF